MRLWTISPEYLDVKGLVALWREGLLAKHVLNGWTKGYRNHPELLRFKAHENPTQIIENYLLEVLKESRKRGYNFDATKISPVPNEKTIPVTQDIIDFEMQHLLNKLKVRDLPKFEEVSLVKDPQIIPVFTKSD